MDVMGIWVFLVVFPIKELGDVLPMSVYYEFVQNNKNINLYSTQYNKEQLYDYHFHHKLCITINNSNKIRYLKLKIMIYYIGSLVLLFPLFQHLNMSWYSFQICCFVVNVLIALARQNFFLNPKPLKILQGWFVCRMDTGLTNIFDTSVTNKNDK